MEDRLAMEAPWSERREHGHVREAIDGLSFFNRYTGRELDTLAPFFRAFEADAGTGIFAEGDASDFLCLLVSGTAEVVKEDQCGVERVVAVAGAGKTLGEMALIDEEPRSAGARLTESAEILVLGKQSFARMGVVHPRLALQFSLTVARLMSRRLRLTSGMLVDHLG